MPTYDFVWVSMIIFINKLNFWLCEFITFEILFDTYMNVLCKNSIADVMLIVKFMFSQVLNLKIT